MTHYRIALTDKVMRKYKIFVRGMFFYQELDGVEYEFLEDAQDAVEKYLNGVSAIVKVVG